jgi:hypothetical protein
MIVRLICKRVAAPHPQRRLQLQRRAHVTGNNIAGPWTEYIIGPLHKYIRKPSPLNTSQSPTPPSDPLQSPASRNW